MVPGGTKKRSAVWSYYTKVGGTNNLAKCNLCKKIIKYCGGTTNLWQHVLRIHTGVETLAEKPQSPQLSDEDDGEVNEKIIILNTETVATENYDFEMMEEPREEPNIKFINEKMGFIGAGNMAKAICEGIVRKGLIKYSQVYVSGPHIENLVGWKDKGANVSTENGRVVEEADVIFLAVKPHILPNAIANMYDTLPQKTLKPKLFVSILAGIPIQQLENVLCALEGSRIIRVMPNTPMMVGEGCTVFSPGQRATERDIEIVRSILSVSGVCKQIPESLINAVGALSGSGPAFVYLMIEALADGGVKMGIPRAMAIEFAAQTVLGAAKMVKETGKHTGELKDEVCSPGGTTITGIHALERGGVRAAIMDAVEAAAIKSVELGEKKHG